MTRRVVDLPRVRQALHRLDELAHDHPEAFDLERLPTEPESLMEAIRRIGRPRSQDPTQGIGVRLPGSLLEALDEAVERRREVDPKVTRNDVIREAIERLLASDKRKAARS